MSKNIDVLLTYGWVRSTYSALKNLSSKGLKVVVSDTSPIGMCQLSKYKEAFFQYSSPTDNPKGFIQDINTIIKENNIDVLIPSHDETEIIAENIDLLPAKLKVPIPSISQLDIANNKYECLQEAMKIGIKVPLTYEYSDIKDLEFQLNKHNEGNKFVIKLRRGNSSKGVFYANSKSHLISSVRKLIAEYKLTPERYPVVQEYVQGEGWGVSCLYWNGQIVTSFTHHRLREKLESGGTSTLRQQCDNPLLEDMAHKLLNSLRWHGLAMVEFKYNSTTGEGWFIEINPRMWGSISLPISSGIHFPYLLYLCATDGPEAARKALKEEVVLRSKISRWYLGDLIIAVQKLRRLSLLEAFQYTLPGGADYYDDISMEDMGAFIGEVGYYGYNLLKYRSMNPVGESVVG